MSRSIQAGTPATVRGILRALIRRLTPMQIGVDIGLAVVFLLFAAPFSVGFSEVDHLGAAVVVSLLMTLALAVRRLSPALALVVAWIGALLQMAAGVPPLPINLAIFGVLYVTAAYGTRLVLWLGFASTMLGAAAITIYLLVGPGLIQNEAPGWGEFFIVASMYLATAFAFALAWILGLLVRIARRAAQTRAAQAEAEREVVIEQERGRIARDMHDVVAHSLAVVIAQADGARYAAKDDPDAAAAALGTIARTARGALTDVRLLLTQLRHNESAGPQPTLADLEQLYAQVRSAGADVRVEVAPTPPGTPPAAVQIAVYRILQEALTNALRHGDGETIWVRLAWHPERVDLEVRNAISPGAQPNKTGHGVVGMSERATLAGGHLHVNHSTGVFVVEATLPIGSPA